MSILLYALCGIYYCKAKKKRSLSFSHILNLVCNNPSYECCNHAKENIQECLRWWAFSVNNEERCNGIKPCND